MHSLACGKGLRLSMQIRQKLMISNFMMFVLPLGIILLAGGMLYLLYQDEYLDRMGNRESDKLAAHRVERQFREMVSELPVEGSRQELREGIIAIAPQVEEEGYHLMVLDRQRVPVFSNCTELDEHLLGEETTPALFVGESSVYIFRSSNIVKYMFTYSGDDYHAIAILSRDLGGIEEDLNNITYIYRIRLILAGVLVFLLADFLLAYQLSRKLQNHLLALQEAAKEVKKGNLDISLPRHKELEEEVAQVYEAFEEMCGRLARSRAERLQYEESRRNMLAGISHDLRTPLTVISGYVQALLDGVASTKEQERRYLEKIHHRTDSMVQLVERLFLCSRLEMGEYPFSFVQTDFSHWLARAAEKLQKELGEEGEVRLSLPEGECPLLMDGTELYRVLQNLMGNARKYGGRPLVFSLVLERQGDKLRLTARDNGKGVAEENLERIFKVLFREEEARTDSAVKGSGLGLSIVRWIVEAHGGKAWAENRGGLAIVMDFPVKTRKESE